MDVTGAAHNAGPVHPDLFALLFHAHSGVEGADLPLHLCMEREVISQGLPSYDEGHSSLIAGGNLAVRLGAETATLHLFYNKGIVTFRQQLPAAFLLDFAVPVKAAVIAGGCGVVPGRCAGAVVGGGRGVVAVLIVHNFFSFLISHQNGNSSRSFLIWANTCGHAPIRQPFTKSGG